MIVGSGDIAKSLNDREGACFFASGVSDSSCKDPAEFKRERDLLLQYEDTGACLFYFSSIDVETKDTPYYRHKLAMEELVKKHFIDYYIIRIGNIDYGTNPKTFLNYLRAKISKGEPVEIYDEYRYVISRDLLVLICDTLPLTGQNELSIFTKKGKVIDLL